MKYYLHINGEAKGPFTLEMVREMLTAGAIENTTLMAQEGGSDWQPAADVLTAAAEPVESGIELECPNCTVTISAGAESAGQAASCPSCGQGVVVPALPQMTPQAACVRSSPEARQGRYPASRTPAGLGARTLPGAQQGRKKSNKTMKTFMATLVGVVILGGVVFGMIYSHGGRSGKIEKTADESPLDFTNQESLASVYSGAANADKLQERKKGDTTLYFLPNSDSPVTGWIKKQPGRYQNKSLLQVVDGRLDGPWVEFFQNGQICIKGSYKNGEKNGMQECWYENGQKEAEIIFDGTGVVTIKRWKPNGELCPETQVHGGNGKAVSYNKDGAPEAIYTYKDGTGTVSFLRN